LDRSDPEVPDVPHVPNVPLVPEMGIKKTLWGLPNNISILDQDLGKIDTVLLLFLPVVKVIIPSAVANRV
jgi:hypothetical protein